MGNCLNNLSLSYNVLYHFITGLDIAKHNEPAYPVEAYGHGHIEKIIQILENTPTQVTQGKSFYPFTVLL